MWFHRAAHRLSLGLCPLHQSLLQSRLLQRKARPGWTQVELSKGFFCCSATCVHPGLAFLCSSLDCSKLWCKGHSPRDKRLGRTSIQPFAGLLAQKPVEILPRIHQLRQAAVSPAAVAAALTLSAEPMQTLQTDHANLCLHAGKERQIALDEFYEQWKDDSLVILKWLGIQTGSNIQGNLQNVQQLLEHPAVNISNPNTCYSTFLGFARSPVNFHAQDGSGYRFMADSTLKVKHTIVRVVLCCCCVVDPAWHVGHCAPKATLLFIF